MLQIQEEEAEAEEEETGGVDGPPRRPASSGTHE